MTSRIADTTVIIHLFRKNAAAIAWVEAQTERLSIAPYTWLGVMYGAPGKRVRQHAAETRAEVDQAAQ